VDLGDARQLVVDMLSRSQTAATWAHPSANLQRIDAELRGIRDAGDVEVSSIEMNGRRVDAHLLLGEREWWIALSLAQDELLVERVDAHERPRPFAGIEGGIVVVVNGPSSSGKSSVMRAVVELASEPWVAFDELWFGEVAMPYLIWPDAAPSLRAGFLAGIAALASQGNQIVMTSGGLPCAEVAAAFEGTRLLTVGLDCPTDVLLERHGGRSDRWGGLVEDSLGAHDGWRYDLRLDSSSLSPADLAQRVLDAVTASDKKNA